MHLLTISVTETSGDIQPIFFVFVQLPIDFRFFNHRDFHCFFVILLSTFCIFHRGDFISESFCTQNVLTTLYGTKLKTCTINLSCLHQQALFH